MAGNSVGVKVVSVVFDKTRLAFSNVYFLHIFKTIKVAKKSLFDIKIDLSELIHTS